MELTTIYLHTRFQVDRVDPRIFGGFLEHIGRAVYEGVYEPDSRHADEDGCRQDVMAAISEQAYGQVFNLGADQVISLKELSELLVTVYGSGAYQEQTFPADRKRIDIGDYYADDQLIRNTLGWAPDVSLEEALKRTIDYYQTFGKHYWEDEVDS